MKEPAVPLLFEKNRATSTVLMLVLINLERVKGERGSQR
jgi:hypothetical protein